MWSPSPTLGWSRTTFTARPILSLLLVPLLASLYLLTETGTELQTREGSTQTLLKHLDEALLNAPWVAFEEARPTSRTPRARPTLLKARLQRPRSCGWS